MAVLNVDLGERSYPIYIESGLLSQENRLTAHIRSKRICIITNDVVAPLCLQHLKNKLGSYIVDEVILPDGEAEKSLHNFDKVFH
jgi:3-dehydroquinate synthase